MISNLKSFFLFPVVIKVKKIVICIQSATCPALHSIIVFNTMAKNGTKSSLECKDRDVMWLTVPSYRKIPIIMIRDVLTKTMNQIN